MTGTGLLLAATVVVAFGLWFVLPRPSRKVPRTFIVLVWALAFAELLPGAAKVAVSALALLGGLFWWLRQPSEERRGARVVGWSIAILGYWTLLLLVHPNVPSLSVGLLGWRQTVFAFGGLILGCAVPRRYLPGAERTVVAALVAALAVSLVSFFWVPSISNMVSRAAGAYTDMFDGQARLQGVFAGPFHIALAAVLLVGWFFVRKREPGCRVLAVVALVVGLVSLRYAEVRTGYVALAVVLVSLVFLTRRPTARLGHMVFLVALGALGYYEFTHGDGSSALTSIANYSTDSRLLNRLPFYQQGLHMVGQSPLFGWGPGSAGDTLGSAYLTGEHVTPHNLLLKVAVEGGVIGLLLWIGLAVAWWRSLIRRGQQGRFALLAVAAFLTFGITTPAIDTLPVSYFVLLLAGLAVGEHAQEPATSEEAQATASARANAQASLP